MSKKEQKPSVLRPDVRELLDGFSKRMKFIHIVRSLITTSLPDNIREMFHNDYDMIDNLVVMVLLLIKDRTLAYNESCTKADIAEFLEQLRPVIPEEYDYNAGELAEYIIVNVLQNSGRLYRYETYNDEKECFEKQTIRLLNEEKGNYQLTDDVFDFLYRSKEIESELDYSVTRFMMAEYMKRRNYTEALKQSRELVERLRNLKLSMDYFILKCRENLSRIMSEEYDQIIGRFTSLMESENEELDHLQQTTLAEIEQAEKAVQSGVDSEETVQNLKSLREISDNLTKTIREQRALINKRGDFSDSYAQILRDSFRIRSYAHMDFDRDVMRQLRGKNGVLNGFASMFLTPLTKPEFRPLFSIENFYAGGKMTDDTEEDAGLNLNSLSDDSKLIRERNRRFSEITRSFFHYASEQKAFRVHDYIGSLSLNQIMDMCEENALPSVLLALYGMEEIDLDRIRADADQAFITEQNGEFDLLNFLHEVPEEDKKMRRIRIEHSDETCVFQVRKQKENRTIEMSDFRIEVEK